MDPGKDNAAYVIDSTLHSYSQILFSENKLLGSVILLASFIHPFAGMNGLLGALSTNLFAHILGHSRREIRVGIFGFNGVLFGMALSLYSGVRDVQIVAFVVLFSILLTAIKASAAAFFQKYSLPFLSAPFVLLTWIVILTGTVDVGSPGYLAGEQFQGYSFSYLSIIFLKNIGLVIFSPDVISGMLIITGLLFFSRTMLLIAVLSFSAIIGFGFIFPQYNQFIVENGFNAILASLAIGGIFFVPGLKSLSMAVIASVFTVIIGNIISGRGFLSAYHIPVLTAPFNIVTILFIYSMQQNVSEAGLYRIYIPGSPEENYKRFLRESEVYGKVDRGLILPFMGWWFVSQGINGRHTHKGIYQWGIDFIVTDKNGKPYKGSGNELDEHYCYDMPVTAPGDGVVYAVESSTSDNPVTKTNLDYSWGNHVIIKHNPSLFSVLCHFGQQKVSVHTNHIVKKGEHIGNVGSSGLAPYPHLHVQFQSSGSIGNPTIPVHFSDFLIKNEDHYEYVPIGIPEERHIAMNVPVDINIKDALGFELGQKNEYEIMINGQKQTEVWHYDMDSTGVLYMESSLHKDRLYYLKNKRAVSFYTYTGRKDCGLFILSLAIDKIPYCADEKLRWQKKIPYFEILTGFRSLLWESVIPYIKCNYMNATHTFQARGSRFVLSSSISMNGRDRIAKRSIVFHNGLSEIKYEARGKVINMKRIA